MLERMIEDQELGALFASFSSYDPVVLAVSGGGDSMALMVLVKRWAEWAKKDLPVVASVDHGLRTGSNEDVTFVARQARLMGFEHHGLKWAGPKPDTGVQEAARLARYQMLVDLVERLGGNKPSVAGAIVTAHHREDQAETFFMRLARGSGVDGLSAMQGCEASLYGSGVAILRPLLDVSKQDLILELKHRGIDWLEDPSNSDERFERVRLRRLQAALDEAGLRAEQVARSAQRLQRVRLALDDIANAALQKSVDVHDGAWGEIRRAEFDVLPEEIRLRVLGHVMRAFGGGGWHIRLSKLEMLCGALGGALAGALEGNETGQDTFTLAGSVLMRTSDHYAVFREPGRSPFGQISLRPGERAIWDNRFEVSTPPDWVGEMTLRALGTQAYARLRSRLEPQHKLLSRAAATLPSFWRGGELAFVPHLGYTALPSGGAAPKLRFLWQNVVSPNFMPRGPEIGVDGV